MNDCVKKKSNKNFNAIIMNKSTTIITVLKEPFFKTKLKSPNKILIEYLNDDKTIVQICDWLLTDKYINDKNYKPISQLIIKIFKDSPEKVLSSFATNQKLIDRLNQFINLEKNDFLIGFGYFQQLIESLSFSTKGSFLQNFNDFPNLLLKFINVISIRYLFYSLSTNFTQFFGFSKEVVLQMLQTMDESNQIHIISLLSKLSKSKNTYFAFDHSKVIFALFEKVVHPSQNEFVITQSLQIIEYVYRNTIIKEKFDVILKYFEARIDFNNLLINFSTSIILKLFSHKFIPSLILLMLNNPTHMFLHEGVMASIEAANDLMLVDFVEKNNVPEKIMWAMKVAKSNGFLTKFAMILNKKRKLTPALQTPEWYNFVSRELNKRSTLLSNQFSSQLISKRNSVQKKSQKNAFKKGQSQQQSDKNERETNEINRKEEKKKKENIKNELQNENQEDNSGNPIERKIKNLSKSKSKSKAKSKTKTEEITKNQPRIEENSGDVQNLNDANENSTETECKAKNKNDKSTEKAKPNASENAANEDASTDKSSNKTSSEKVTQENSVRKIEIENSIGNDESNQNGQYSIEGEELKKSNELDSNENDIENSIQDDQSTSKSTEAESCENQEKKESGQVNSTPLPKILDSFLIKSLILQRLNQNEADNSENASKSLNVENESFSKAERVENEEENNLNKGEISSELETPTSNRNKRKETENQARMPTNDDELLADHCRISMLKKKLYKNSDDWQTKSVNSPKEEKCRARSFSKNFSPSPSRPINPSKIDVVRHRKTKSINDFDDFNHKIDFSGSDEYSEDNTKQPLEKKKVIDLFDDFSSSSDDETICFTENKHELIGPTSTEYVVHTIFGPALVRNDVSEAADVSSDSSDDEFEFKFSPTPQIFMRRSSFNYRGSFGSIYDKNYGYC